MAKAKQPQTSNVVQPIIRVEGEPNILESLFDGPEDEMPTLKSIGYCKVTGSGWISYVIHTKGTKVVKVEPSEPNMKAIAEEESKINFVKCFVDELL